MNVAIFDESGLESLVHSISFSRNTESVELLIARVLAKTSAERQKAPSVGMQTQWDKYTEFGNSIINCFSFEGNSYKTLPLKWHTLL